MSAGLVILILKVAVITVTVLLAASLVAVWRGNYRLHGQINLVFFVLTMMALIGLEVGARILNPEMFADYFERKNAQGELRIHLSFSLPAACLLPLMLYTGWRRQRRLHLILGWIFLGFWIGTFITGIFFLPHEW
jgi:uncharacterized membrane protein YozB (DUF420 family)